MRGTLVWEKSEKPQRPRGKYRNGMFRSGGVMVGGHECMSPAHIPVAVHKLVSMFKDERDSMQVHFEFENIHPFWDGNGRVGRLLWAWHRLWTGQHVQPILNWFPGYDFYERRFAYYQALSRYHNDNGKTRC